MQGQSIYQHDSVAVFDYYDSASGYFIFEARAPRPVVAPLVLFLHGYGAMNPAIYGDWISHLVRQGYTVIYPRYQQNLFYPATSAFPENAAIALRSALQRLCTISEHVPPLTEACVYTGHSYGGVIAANLAARHLELELAPPKGLFLVAAGAGPFTGAVLDSYSEIPANVPLLQLGHTNDWVVGTDWMEALRQKAPQIEAQTLLVQTEERCGDKELGATHFEAYSPSEDYDNGFYNITYYRALQKGRTDELDAQLIWPIFDELLQAAYQPNRTSVNWKIQLSRWYNHLRRHCATDLFGAN